VPLAESEGLGEFLLLLMLVSPPLGEVESDAGDVGLVSAVAEGLPLALPLTGGVLALVERTGVVTALELTQSVPAVLSFAVALMFDSAVLVKAAGVAVAVVLVSGLPLVVSPELGLTVSVGLVTVGDGVVGWEDGGAGDVLAGVGVTVLLGLVAGLAGAAVLLGGHTVTVGMAEVAGVVATPSVPPEALPSTRPGELGDGPVAPVVCCEESPTELPSWTKAARSGGSDSATPIANTAQATATTGRSMRCRQSSGGRAWPLLLRPCRPEAAALCVRAAGTAVPPSRARWRRAR
jgi:hypothetical protein